MKQIVMTITEFLRSWFGDEGFREENADLAKGLRDHGLGDASGEDVHQAMVLIADELPPVHAQQLNSYFNATSGAQGGKSAFNVQQGGGSGAAAAGGNATNAGGAAGAGAAIAPPPALYPQEGETNLDTAVKQIQYITNNVTNVTETNTTNIDDRDTIVDNSVQQSFSAGGDIGLDQDITNTVVSGDGNTVTGDVGSGANVVSGDVSGQFVGGDVRESNLIGGDNSGIAAADGDVVGAAVGDGNTVIGADGDLEGNVNIGGQQTVVDAHGPVNTGSGDQILAEGSAINTGDYGEATLDQSHNVEIGDIDVNVDHSIDNSVDQSLDVDVNLGRESSSEESLDRAAQEAAAQEAVVPEVEQIEETQV